MKLSLIVSILIFAITGHTAFENKNISTRATGLGDAFTAVADYPSAIFLNPGGLTFINKPLLELFHTNFYQMAELGYTCINFVRPVNIGKLNSAFSLNLQNFGFELYREFIGGVGYSLNIGRSTGIGFNFKYAGIYIETIGSSSTFTLDTGILHHITEKISTGFFCSNISFSNISGESLPVGFSGGISYRIIKPILLCLDIYKQIKPANEGFSYGLKSLSRELQNSIKDLLSDEEEKKYNEYLKNFDDTKPIYSEYRFGIEYTLFQFLDFRIGFKNISSGRNKFSLGFGINLSGVILDYAYQFHPELYHTHYLSLIFGKLEKKIKIAYIKGKLDINLASIEELMELPDIGRKTAENIIEYRKKIKRFESIEQLKQVKGIGPKTYEKIKDKVCITDIPPE